MNAFTLSQPDGLALSGHIHSPPAPRAVMSLVHGFGEHQGRYAHMVEHLNAQNIAIVTMDLRGHGISGGKRGVCNDYGLLISDVSAQLEKARQAFPDIPHYLYGHSMGGGLVLRYVSRASRAKGLSGVIASAPLLRVPKAVPKLQLGALRLMQKIAPDLTVPNPIAGAQISTLQAEQSQYEADTLNHGKLGIGLALAMFENGQTVLARAADFALPTLIMHAKEDALTASAASEEFAALAPNCALHLFENCAHEMHNDTAREAVYALMLEFIQ